jgi:hypothetical protein
MGIGGVQMQGSFASLRMTTYLMTAALLRMTTYLMTAALLRMTTYIDHSRFA